MIRLSVSDLETWRYYKASETRDLVDLVADLSRTAPPTPQMRAGAALAKFWETAEPNQPFDEVDVDGWRFVFELDADVMRPPVRELKGEMFFDTPSGPVTLVGKVDGLQGRTVRDQKLTEAWDAEKYLDSLQWRAYLLMFNADRFIYDVFQARYDSDGAQEVTITGYHQFPLYAYPGMRADVERAVAELADVVTTYMPQRAAQGAR